MNDTNKFDCSLQKQKKITYFCYACDFFPHLFTQKKVTWYCYSKKNCATLDFVKFLTLILLRIYLSSSMHMGILFVCTCFIFLISPIYCNLLTCSCNIYYLLYRGTFSKIISLPYSFLNAVFVTSTLVNLICFKFQYLAATCFNMSS